VHALRPAAVIVASVFAVPSLAAACPFCGVVAEPLAARRDAAGAVAVAEGAGEARRDDSGLLVEPLRLRQWIRGESGDGVGGEVLARVDSPIRGTAVAFGPRDHGGRWSGIPADESLIVHVATAPRTDEPAVQRLRWFAKRLTHPDPAVADDALAEFAAANGIVFIGLRCRSPAGLGGRAAWPRKATGILRPGTGPRGRRRSR